jgi:murein DD-endopeptidase
MNNPLILVDPDGNTPWPALIAGIYYPKRTGDRAFSPSRKSPVDGVSRPHKGIDLGHHPIQGSLKGGESVLAAAEGVVSFVSKKESKSAGWYIEIDHGGGYTSRYLHLQEKPNLKKGDVITNEQEIGKVGSTGRSTGNHLHFEILKDGNPIDPTSIYDLQEVINPDNVGTKGYGLEGQPPIQLKPIDINAPKVEPIIDEINESTN